MASLPRTVVLMLSGQALGGGIAKMWNVPPVAGTGHDSLCDWHRSPSNNIAYGAWQAHLLGG